MNDSKGFNVIRRVVREWSWAIYCILLIAVTVPLVLVARLVVRDVKEFEAAGRRDGIAMALEHDDDDWNLPHTTASPKKHNFTKESTHRQNSDCFTELHRRKTAAALARTGDLQNALALLNANRSGRELSKSAADSAVAKMRHLLPTLWSDQVRTLQTFWKSLSPRQRQALFPTSIENGGANLTDLLSQVQVDDRQLADAMPDSLTYVVLCNVHTAMIADVGVPPGVVELYLDDLFRRQTTAKRMYWKSEKTTIAYDDHLNAYCRALDQHALWPLLIALAKNNQKRLRSGDATAMRWFQSVWGERFCRELKEFDFFKTNAHRQFPWKRIPPTATRFWADKLHRDLQKNTPTPLAPAVIAADPWLSALNQPLDHDYTLTAIRTHPNWQAALRVFDYAKAVEAAYDTLTILNAGRFYVQVTGKGRTIELENLLKSLNVERRTVISKTFPWLTLIVELGGVGDGVPAYVRKARGRKPVTRPVGKRWRDIPPQRVLNALKRLSERRGADTNYFKAVITFYSKNRNLKSGR